MAIGECRGTGRYSYNEVSAGKTSVMVSKLPEEFYSVRVKVREMGEVLGALVLRETSAQLLWAALNRMAKDLDWHEDRI